MHQTLLDPQFGGCRLANLQILFNLQMADVTALNTDTSQMVRIMNKCEVKLFANETFQENFLAQDQHYFGSLSPDIRSLNDWLVRPFFFDCDMLTALSLSGT